MKPTSGEGKFINGKEQVIDLVRKLHPEQRKQLLNNVRKRNPHIAMEISQKSLDFNSIYNLPENQILNLVNFIPAEIMGIALKGSPESVQIRVLKFCDRNYALKAFEILNTPITEAHLKISKAQHRILEKISEIYGPDNLRVYS